MSKIQHTMVVFLILALAASGAASGETQTLTAEIDEDFSPGDVETLTVLAVADVRKDKSVDFKKLDVLGHKTVKSRLKKSTYTLQFEQAVGEVAEVTEDDLEYRDAEWVRQLGPDGERYVLLLVLEDAARKNTFGSAFGSVCSGYLFDKEKGEAVWEHHATGTAGQGGLMGFAMNNSMRGAAFSSCAGSLMATFPQVRRPKGKKK